MDEYSYIKNPKIRRFFRELAKEAKRRRWSIDRLHAHWLRMQWREHLKTKAAENGRSGNIRAEVVPPKKKVRGGTD